MRSRGRFTPAVDSNGMPAAGRVSERRVVVTRPLSSI